MNLINSYLFGPASAPDPYFSSVSLLLHMQGANGGTSFPDSSSHAFSVTPSGNAQTSTSLPKWGTSCGLFDGTGDYLTVAANSAFDFGTGDFTIEWWYKSQALGAIYQYFFDIGSNGTSARIYNNQTLLVYIGGAVSINSTTISPALSVGAWYHMALVRSGSTVTFYIDGVSKATSTDTHSAGSSSLPLRIGDYGGGGFGVFGNLQDFRITKGVARTGFPPTAQFPDS